MPHSIGFRGVAATVVFCLPMLTASAQLRTVAQLPTVTFAIEHVTVLPMTHDTALVDHTVLISGDRISWIGLARNANVLIPRAARRIDGKGAYLIPGLADMHVHIDRRSDLADFLAAGITTVRNMRGAPVHLAWRDSIARSTLAGPVIFTTGPSLRGREGEGFAAVRNPADAEAVVRRQTALGYDMIKVLYAITPETYQRITNVARELKIPVVGHVISEVGLTRSLAAGQISLEHAAGLVQLPMGARLADRLGEWLGDSTPPRPEWDQSAREIARAGAWVGTIISTRDGLCGAPTDRSRHVITALLREKVRLLAGADVGIGPIRARTGLHCELRTLVASGLTPYQALTTATANPGAFAKAHLRSKDVFGTVVVGARADLVLLSRDPRKDIRAVEQPAAVVIRGRQNR